MKLYLASFIEPENFGPGRVIGIANGSKPEHVRCETVFLHFVPSDKIMKDYYFEKKRSPTKAAENFVKAFSKQLDDFAAKIEELSEEKDAYIQDLLPFKDGDTLASWEREERSNYRDLVEKTLLRLGYEVERH